MKRTDGKTTPGHVQAPPMAKTYAGIAVSEVKRGR